MFLLIITFDLSRILQPTPAVHKIFLTWNRSKLFKSRCETKAVAHLQQGFLLNCSQFHWRLQLLLGLTQYELTPCSKVVLLRLFCLEIITLLVANCLMTLRHKMSCYTFYFIESRAHIIWRTLYHFFNQN